MPVLREVMLIAHLLPLLFVGGAGPEPAVTGPWADRVAALQRVLRHGPGPVRLVVLGDSLTAGWGVDDPEVDPYCRLFERALRARYPEARVEVIAAGGPGDPSRTGLSRVDREVISRQPQVVVLQFGGNDERLGRSPRQLTDDLAKLIRTVTSPPLSALCLVATPPMNDVEGNSPFVRAALFAAQGEGVPVADFDAALRRSGRDFRGPFCWGAHPGPYSHVLMARELLGAWDRLLGSKPRLSVEIEGYTKLLAEPTLPPLRAVARNLGDRELEVEFECGSRLLLEQGRLRLAVGQQEEVSARPALPTLDRSGRTETARLWALARSVEAGASDLVVKWLALAPVVTPDVAGDPIDRTRLTWHRLSPDCLVVGRDAWEGEEDLSARFALALQGKRLLVLVEVTDDALNVASPPAHPTDGDCVEVYLDLRFSAEQGQPFYSPDVVDLLVRPASSAWGRTTWTTLDKVTDRLRGVSVQGERTPRGYQVQVVFPEEVLRREGEPDFTGVGFDLAVNDSDVGHSRKTQLMWAGAARNFLNPAAFAALAAPSPTPPKWRATLR